MVGKFSQQLEGESIAPKDVKSENDFKKAIKRAGDAREKMKHGFKFGKKRGETTHIKPLDKHFTWKPGFLYCITGWPQHGKTELTQFLALIQSVVSGKKWAVHSPENYPEEEFFDSLAHTLVGKSTDRKYANQMTEKEYDTAIDFIHEHFYYVYQEGVPHTPDFVRDAFAYTHAEFGIYGTITDPWNKLAHKRGSSSIDDYLSDQLPKEQKLGRELDLVRIICAHPRTPRDLERGKPLPIPDQYSLHGGQMWDNMCDVIASVYRPNYHSDKTDTWTQFISHKIKKQNLVGVPGTVDFNYNRGEARYYYDGICPLTPHIVQPESNFEIRKLPESKFESEPAPF